MVAGTVPSGRHPSVANCSTWYWGSQNHTLGDALTDSAASLGASSNMVLLHPGLLQPGGTYTVTFVAQPGFSDGRVRDPV